MRTDVAQGKKLSLTRKSGLTAALLLFLCALAPALALGVCTLADTDVALAADGDYEFTVGTSEGFTFGSPYNIASEKGYPSVTVDFKGTVDGGSGFWYYLGTETELPENVQWTELTSDSNPIDADGAYTFTLNSIIAEVTDYYESYIFFRGGNPTTEEYYIDSTARKIVLINSNNVKPSIDSISAVTGDGTTNYDLTMQNGNWTNTAIRITAVSNYSGNPNAVKFRYKLGNDGEERPFDSVAAGENGVVGTVTIGGNKDGDVREYAGEIIFIVADAALVNSYTSTSSGTSYYLNIDMNAPDFRVNATVQTAAGATVAYSANDWTPYSVTMQLSFNNALFSGIASVDYLVKSGDASVQSGTLSPEGNVYSLRWERDGVYSVAFTVRSNSALSQTVTFNIKKDSTAPSIVLSAQDAGGTPIVSLGETAPVGGRAAFAANGISFTMSNGNAMQDGNTLTYQYSLDGGNIWQSMVDTAVGDTKNLSLQNTSAVDYNGDTVKFRITAATGLYDEREFTFAVLDQHFYNDMQLNVPEAAGGSDWINAPVTATFTLPIYLSDSMLQEDENEYTIYGYYTEVGYTDAAVTMVPVIEDASDRPGYVRYTVTIEQSLNNQSYSFRIYDRSRNYVDFEYDENGNLVTDEEDETVTFPLLTPQLRVDTEIPTADVTAKIGNTELTADDWAAGAVTITITPASVPVSGLNCYALFGEGHASETAIPTQADGKTYSVTVRESGVYSYRLISGAGNYADFSVRVNIDNTSIHFVDFEEDGVAPELWKPIVTEIMTDSGETIAAESAYDSVSGSYVMENVFSDVVIAFNSNHNGHFSILYRAIATSGDNGFIVYPGNEDYPGCFVLELPDDSDAGTLTYNFMLRSNAVNSAGEYSITDEMIKLVVEYDKATFGIKAEGYTEAVWSYDEIELQFSLSEANDSVRIERYEYSFNGTEWQNTGADVQSDNSAIWTYGGEPVVIDGMDVPTGGAYAGIIFIRAVADTGHVSTAIKLSVYVDTTAPEPLYALPDPAAVSIVNLGSFGNYISYNVYSGGALTLTGGHNGGWNGMGEMSFAYSSYTSSSDNPAALGFTSASELGEIASDATYWLRATKGGKTSYALVHFMIFDPDTDARITMEVGGTISEGGSTGGVTWSSSAEVSLSARASTGVYFWYSVENDDNGQPIWLRLNETAAALDAGNAVTWTVNFVGSATGEESFVIGNLQTTITGNARYNVRFRATDLFGNEAVDGRNYIIRIDDSTPNFEVGFITPSHPEGLSGDYYSTDGGETQWITEAVNVTVTESVSSPGGVRYSYQIGRLNDNGVITYTGEWQLISGNSFSTNHIVGFDDNGPIVIIVRAEALASGKVYQSAAYTLRIDQIVPEFALSGSAVYLDDEGNEESTRTLAPDQWTNADRVDIGISNRAENASPVIYYFKWSDENVDFEQWGEIGTVKSSNTIRTLTVRAVSGNGYGITVEHTFTVNIDNVAPVIHAGNIRNSETGEPLEYYIDQEITYVEANLKSATYNNFLLSNGQIIATNTVDNSNGGRVEIRVEDMAGNVTTLTFIMTIFPLNVNNITTSTQDRELLNRLENDYNAAAQAGGLTESRMQYFETLIQRLKDRLIMLETQIGAYRNYLSQVNSKQSFTLESDYNTMFTYINYFETKDEQIRYPDWMQQAILEGEYRTYYLKLETEFEKLQILMEEVLTIEDEVVLLPATNVVAREDYQNIIRVYNEYDSLARDQKAVFTPNLLNKLTELRRICEVLLMQDESTGISIDGDHLVGELGGSSLTVTSYAAESQYFIEAQSTLFNQMAPTESRKILSINRLSLEGAGAEFDTGIITVTLPIPEDYRQYVYFAVYELSPDGTITKIETSRISPDAETVYFTTDHLSTYILATTANVVVAEEPEKIYGSIAGIEVDATMLTYITYSVVAMFVIFVIIILLIAWRRRKFLQGYNRDHKKALIRRGIHSIPKGNPPPPSNPANPIERVGHDPQVFYRGKKR